MPDITMCRDTECWRREMCHRFMAKPSMRQSYFAESPRSDRACTEFWHDSDDKIAQLRKLEKAGVVRQDVMVYHVMLPDKLPEVFREEYAKHGEIRW